MMHMKPIPLLESTLSVIYDNDIINLPIVYKHVGEKPPGLIASLGVV